MFKRNIRERLQLYLNVFPVVLLTGARQTGKTVLAHEIAKSKKYAYITLDDASNLASAKQDPVTFLKYQNKPLIIDEVQRVPELFLAIKKVVDEEKKLGQFILTGSANPLFLPQVGDSLAGRMGTLRMYPFSQGELLKKKESFISWVFSSDFQTMQFADVNLIELGEIIYKGGFPKVHALKSTAEVDVWIEGYLQAMMDRDIKDLAHIEGLYHFPNLLKILAHRSGSLFNGADIGRTLKLSSASVHRYIALLEALFFVFRSPAWFSNRTKRIAKSPKVYICDTGILSYLLQATATTFQTDPSLFGFLLESFIVAELLKQASWHEEKVEQYHYREGSYEVDIVLEQRGGNIVGIEIKSAAVVRPADFSGMKRLQQLAGKKFLLGMILYSGSQILPFGDQMWAVPISALWK